MKKQNAREKKFAVWLKLWEYLDGDYKILFLNTSDITATLLQDVRKAIEPLGASILVAKNTVLKAGILRKMKKPKNTDDDFEVRNKNYRPRPELKKLIELCNGETILIFYKGNIMELKEKIESFACSKLAKVGMKAPSDYVLSRIPYGVYVNNSKYFKDAKVPYKICRGIIQLVEETKVLTKGHIITKEQTDLFGVLKLKAAIYNLTITHVYDNGLVYDASVLYLTKKDVAKRFCKGVENMVAVAMETKYPIYLSVKQIILGSFKNVLAFTLATEYEVSQFKDAKETFIKTISVIEEELERKDDSLFGNLFECD